MGGPAVKSIDGKYAIRLVRAKSEEFDGTVYEDSQLIVTLNGVDQKPCFVSCKEGVDFFWGPKESGFAVFRAKGEGRLWTWRWTSREQSAYAKLTEGFDLTSRPGGFW